LKEQQNNLVDPLGRAMLDYFNGVRDRELLVSSSVELEGPMEPGHFFRTAENLPPLEKIALEYCRGKVLDVGAGAGCHSAILQNQGLEVHPIELSEYSYETMRLREIKNARLINFFELENESYDTILFLMNGFGIGETLEGLEKLLLKSKSLLRPGGQIIADSADIIYAYMDEENAVYINLNDDYYGEITYTVRYDGETSSFPWLFVDYFMVNDLANKIGLNFELLKEGDYYNYLCRLSID